MLLKMLFAAALPGLFMFSACTASEAQSPSFKYQQAPGKKISETANGILIALLPLDNASPRAGDTIKFSWTKLAAAARYRLEIAEAYGEARLKTITLSNTNSYSTRAAQLHDSNDVRWRVVALDQTENVVAQTDWRTLLAPSSDCED